jgi:hypothetical protein
VANEALHARLEEQGYEGVELTEDDYESELRPVLN